ncbi:hypothetical protein HID58_082964 [Brassica napus]|uniref:HD domain-containing protein n=1 Tax=Brassica napus TaxID=3708 RepID=A0ABQ7YEM8_BRANA|nr:hypothetical protein HID58_082964 [Brassica napus]
MGLYIIRPKLSDKAEQSKHTTNAKKINNNKKMRNRVFFSKSLSLTPPHLRFFHLPAAASSPNGAVHCMADDSPLSQPPNRSGDGSVSAPPPSPAAIDFLSLCSRLKVNVTSSSDSIERDRVSLLSCMKMAIVHDIAEAIVGDITPSCGVSKEEKNRRESEALEHMCKLLGGGERAEEIAELWREYEANASPEAKVVKDFDKLEMILQALEYEQEQGQDLEEFFQSTAGKFQTDIGKAWALEIASRRRKRQ